MPLVLLYGVPLDNYFEYIKDLKDTMEIDRLRKTHDRLCPIWFDADNYRQTPPDFLGYRYYYNDGSGLYKLDLHEPPASEFLTHIATVFKTTPAWYAFTDDYR